MNTYIPGSINLTWMDILGDVNVILTSDGDIDVDAMIEDYKSRHCE